MIEKNHKNIATLIHLGTFSKYIIPLGNYIVPAVLWMTNKEKSSFINKHGKEAINFQLSILLYAIIIGVLTIPFLAIPIIGSGLLGLEGFDLYSSDGAGILIGAFSIGSITLIGFIIELIFVITATLKANKGEAYRYPLSIRFIK